MPLTRSWITAGKAIFTIANPAGDHYTYRVLQYEANSYYPETYFVSLLTGPSNETDYTYLGILRPGTGEVVLTAKSGYTADMIPVRVLRWALARIWKGLSLPEGYRLHHEGRCGRCGRVLTVPESVASGYGPECIKFIAEARGGNGLSSG
jgi:hypothetical protein